jgi:hypothetical protein
MTQKLSPTALRAKRARDKAAAMTPHRRSLKADNQRRHRKDNKDGSWDWDHKDNRWEKPSENRDSSKERNY